MSKEHKQSERVTIPVVVNNPDILAQQFYRQYDIDYWLHKVNLLKTTHDEFSIVKVKIDNKMSDDEEANYKRMLRTEIHFLYYQMIETLYELIFAFSKHDNRYIWLALAFANDRRTDFYSDTYNRIKDISDGAPSSFKWWTDVSTEIHGTAQNVPLIQWLFYFVYTSKLPSKEWQANLDSIERLLKMFARDFSDRGEYNAFKHSLRLYNAPLDLRIRAENVGPDAPWYSMGSSPDSIAYLEPHKEDINDGADGTGNVRIRVDQTTKSFDHERDVRCCLVIHALIQNMFLTRKHSYVPGCIGEEFQFSTFNNITPTDFHPKVGTTKFRIIA